ncbi:cation acetate symporter [Pseudonocardia benzenivorans]|uniref:Na+/solute symporter n=3 Tax=Pseudonocardia TaxID=1847 RepID=F4CIN5_PSEUX|nr:cation acetate symporter [Pseudonocardia dioxanivorans]AEA22432.1 Na+/solute symporter [Pseudonocardia dioxanivorans CB1190]
MNTAALAAMGAIVLVAVVSALVGAYGVRRRATSDFLVASRTSGTAAHAGAISGEYLSAASFLGIAGLVLKEGVDALWYPVGFTAGYLALLLFIAAPLRRSGAYTPSDFAEARLGSAYLRRVCTVFVLVLGWLYVLPQLQGAGLTIATVTGLPQWVGVVAAGVVIAVTVAFGGLRSITLVQAFQYWLKLTALALPAVIALMFFLGADRTFDRPAPPQFSAPTTVDVATDVVLQTAAPVQVSAVGTVDGVPVDGPLTWQAGAHTVQRGTTLEFDAGAPVPVVAGSPVQDAGWLTPFASGGGHGLLAVYSLILATFLGTMGLPHVLGRFYTNPDGRAARRSAVVALGMLGAFYLLVTLLGALSRLYTPQLLVSGETDAAVLLLPTGVLGHGWAGTILGGIVAAGAWSAFLSTSSGLLTSVAGVLSTDVLRGRARDIRIATLLAGSVPILLALVVTRLDFSESVALVFAVAASTFCPLLVLGVWWRGLTARGASWGIIVGGTVAVGAVTASLAGAGDGGLLGVLLHRPAVVSVPLAFLTMIVVSRATARERPADTDQVLLRLHAPERLGLSKDTPEQRPARTVD